MPFDGLRVLSLESRRAEEMATLIRKQSGEPFVAPSMREVDLQQHDEAFLFAARLIAGQVDDVILTTSMQLINLLRIAEEEGIAQQVREALQSAFIGSIGPTTSETLEDCGLKADFEPSHPKMGLLVNEAAGLAAAALANKR